jgi:hypothetical protein
MTVLVVAVGDIHNRHRLSGQSRQRSGCANLSPASEGR